MSKETLLKVFLQCPSTVLKKTHFIETAFEWGGFI